MSSFGKIERQLAHILARFPGIKTRLKRLYQQGNYLFYRKPYLFKLHEKVSMEQVLSKDTYGHFWGYYDSSPKEQGKFLSHAYKEALIMEDHPASYVDIVLNDKSVSKTNAWNWQQGSRLFWVDKDTILHNVCQDDTYKSKMISLRDGASRIIDKPVYAFHKESRTALGLNFERLSLTDRAYGYASLPAKQKLICEDAMDGIYAIDIDTNSHELIISLADLKAFHPRPEMEDAIHSVNHMQLSPSANRFMFLHRWNHKNGKKYSRLISTDIKGKDLYLLSDDNMVSHCNWKNDREIIGWMHKAKKGNAYYVLQDRTPDFKEIGKGQLDQDGHPSMSPCGTYLLTDTYPDRARMSHVRLFNLKTRQLITLGSFYAPLHFFGAKRCDLHPKFTEANEVTVDSAHTGQRQQYKMDISHLL